MSIQFGVDNWSVSEVEWDIMWFDRETVRDTLDDIHLEPHQRVNHFRNHFELTRKDLLIKNLKRTKKQLQKDGKAEEAAQYDFFPQTFQLPGEYAIFVECFKRSNSIWIMKPVRVPSLPSNRIKSSIFSLAVF